MPLEMSKLKTSATRLKRERERGSLSLSPYKTGKEPDGEPLIKTEKYTEMHPSIQFMQQCEIFPGHCEIQKLQTLSSAFSRSSVRTHLASFPGARWHQHTIMDMPALGESTLVSLHNLM